MGAMNTAEPERVERRLTAILAADVVGYSRLMGADEEGTLAALKAIRRELVDPRIIDHRGRIVKTTGDGLLLEFASVVDAVRCAVDVQREMAGRNTGLAAATRIEFRIGINLGDIIIDGDDIFGDGVNVAARLETLAEPGGICVSRVVRDQVRDKLAFAFEDMGEQQVKNIARPVRAFAVSIGSRASRPPVGTEGAGETPAVQTAPALALPDKPSIAVLPFQNMSGDPEQEYFADGMVEDIITELSRFRALFVIARNSTFTYKGRPVDVRQVARELGVRYVVEGSIRKAGNRVRVTAQLIDAATGNHLWAERYDHTLEDVFAVQEDVTRNIVAAVAPSVEMAEVAHARRAVPNADAAQLAWRAQGLLYDALSKGPAPLILEAITTATQAIAADPASLSAYSTLGWAYSMCHLYRWGPEPEKGLDAAWSVVERMLNIDPLDDRTLAQCGIIRVMRGDHTRGIADLRRAIEINPNSASSLATLAYAEATAGFGEDAKEHGLLALRLSPRRDQWVGPAQLALAMASCCAHEYDEAVRWAGLAIQSQPSAPIRRSIMIACCARAGDLPRAAQERAVLDGFAPDFIASLFRGENRVFTRPEDMEHLLDGLRLAAGDGS
jgi:adenylate cyclase